MSYEKGGLFAMAVFVKKTFLVLLLLVLVFYPSGAMAVEGKIATVVVTPPEVAVLVRFVGGPVVEVHSLFDWAEDGSLTRRLRSWPKDAYLIALMPGERGIPRGEKRVKYMYDFLPYDRDVFDKYFFDPATISFMSSRLLVLLTEIEPSMYDYFQRRLAEFQSRLDSVIGVGREIMNGLFILDLSGRMEFLLKASGAETLRPPVNCFDDWRKGEGIVELEKYIEYTKARGGLVVADVWSPPLIKETLSNLSCAILLPTPKVDEMWTTYLHDIYLTLWNRFKAVYG